MSAHCDYHEMDFSDGKLPPHKFIGQWSQDDPADALPKRAIEAHWSWPKIMPEPQLKQAAAALPVSFAGFSKEMLEAICVTQAQALMRRGEVFRALTQAPEPAVDGQGEVERLRQLLEKKNKEIENLRHDVRYFENRVQVVADNRDQLRSELRTREAGSKLTKLGQDIIATIKSEPPYDEVPPHVREKIAALLTPEFFFQSIRVADENIKQRILARVRRIVEESA